MEDVLSSPDPLSNSPTFYSPRKTRRTAASRQSLPVQSSSPTKQTFELDVGNRLSPQKLIVTVEAESVGGNPLSRGRRSQPSPSRRPLQTKERTVTTTIPVKGLSDSENDTQAAPTPKRGRGRPKKVTDTAASAKKVRNGTPSRKKSIGDLVDGDDEYDFDFNIGKNVEMGRGKGKSRSRSAKGTSRTSTPALETTEADEASLATTNKKPRGRPRRMSLLLDNVLLRKETNGPSNYEEYTGSNVKPSANSRVDSTKTLGWGRSGRSAPGNESLPISDRPSPRAFELSSQTRELSPNPLPLASPENSRLSQCGKAGVAAQPQGIEPDSTPEASDEEDLEDDHEEGDEVGEMREFDTILESEEFSMISVDSVPSLRQHLSSPVIQEDQPIPKLANQRIQSLREVTADDDSFSSIPEEVFTAATPARKTRSQNLLSVPATVDDSFSSIPPGILEAATPGRKTHLSKLQSSKFVDHSFSGGSPEIFQAPTPDQALAKELATIPGQDKISTYDSLAPVIQAPTSYALAPLRLSMDVNKSVEAIVETSNFLGTGRSVSASHSTTDRLPTPEETPSPGIDSIREPQQPANLSLTNSSSRTTEPNTANDSSSMHSYMPSSPPLIAARRYTYTAHLRRRSQLHLDVAHTPSIVFSSPALPPPIISQRDHPALKSGSMQDPRPALSPVARAGQALQNIIVPSSPRSRSLSLRSPFKSPAPDRKSSSVLKECLPSPSKERGIKHLPRLDLNSNLSASSHNTVRAQTDDPFNNSNAVQQRSPSPEENDRPYKLELPRKTRLSDTRISTIKSATMLNHSLSEDAMSWQAEEEVSIPEGNSSVVRLQLSAEAMEQKWADERAAVSKEIAAADPYRVIVVDSDGEDIDRGSAGDDEEDFGLLLETINSSSPAPDPDEQSNKFMEKPRRSKIPSPWRKNSKRLVYSDELSHISSMVDSPHASIPTSISKGFAMAGRSQPATITHHETPLLSDEIDGANISNWQIPQKSNFKPRVRATAELDISALLSPVKPLPVLPRRTQQPSVQNVPISSPELESDGATDEKKTVESRPMSDNPFPPIPQKAGFNPTSRNSSPLKTPTTQSLFNHPSKARSFAPGFEAISKIPSEQRAPLISKKPQNLNRQQVPQEPSSSSLNSEDSALYSQDSTVEKENISTHPENRTLKWAQSLHHATRIIQTPLPDRTISPTKSCFRNLTSPSKNVAFVSSSPVPSPSQENVLLSATEWSKKHWVLLDEILAVHKAEVKTEISHSGDDMKPVKKRRNSTRVISKLLGRKVTSQGEEMILEQWHLEVVDEFRGRVPGWEEKVIAMRVFALVVGAERRKLGLIQ